MNGSSIQFQALRALGLDYVPPKEELRLLAANFKVVREEVVIPTSP